MSQQHYRADIVAVMGATGSGKSSSIVELLENDDGPRRILYDPGRDYGRFGETVPDLKALARRVVAAGRGPFSLVFNPTFDRDRDCREFGLLCELAWAAGNVMLAADELAGVMLPNWAPAGWLKLVSTGRKRGVRIVAASQRPAQVEKSFWDQATVVRCGRLNGLDSAATVARVLMVDPRELIALPPMHWIQRSIYKPIIVRGRIEWQGGHPHSVILSKKSLPGAAPAAPPL